jgi:GTP cyclohydrolase I
MTERRIEHPLPEHLRRLVDEIENEIGEGPPSPDGAEAIGPGDLDLPAALGSLAIEGASATAGTGASPSPIEDAVRDILTEIGEDPTRPGLLGTPSRVHRMYRELTAGYHVDPDRLINGAMFDVDYSEMVVVKDVPFYSLCEHHLLPFFGRAGVAYIPRGRVLGLSKIPRIVEMYARRLQVQERMTLQIAEFLMERLDPKGVGVVLEASHLCAIMRGIRKPGTVMTTSHVLGLFRTSDKTRAEFFAHLARPTPEA